MIARRSPAVILVTGGTGLVGSALKLLVESEPVGSRFGKRNEEERWIFLSGRSDGDLRDEEETLKIFEKIRPTHVIHLAALVGGPHDNYDLQNSHVIPGLIHKCFLAKKNNTPFVVAGSGKPLRQFIYSADLAKLFVWQLWEYNEISPIILSVGEEDEVSIKQVADAIVKAIGFQGDYSFDASQADGQFKKTASNAKLRKLLPDFRFTPFETALEESVKWFVENYTTEARVGNTNHVT